MRGLLKVQLGFMGAGILLALTMSTGPEGKAVAPYGFLVLALALPAILLFVGLPVAVHEAGHALVAWAFGVRVVGFDVLGFEILRRAHREVTQSAPWGYIQVETTSIQDRRGVWVPFLLSGPLLGALFAAFEFALGKAWLSGFGGVFIMQGILGVMLSVVSLVPHTSKHGFKTDGARLVDILGKTPQTFAFQALGRVLRAVQHGGILAADPEDLQRAVCDLEGSWRAYAAGLALDRTMIAEPEAVLTASGVYMEAAEQTTDPVLTTDSRLEAAFCQAFFQKDVATAEALLESISQIPNLCWPTARRVDVALALARRDVAGAHIRLLSALQALGREEKRPHFVGPTSRQILELVEARVRSSASA